MKISLILKIMLFAVISAGYIVSSIKFGERSVWTISLFVSVFISLVWIVYDKGYDRLLKSKNNPANVFIPIALAMFFVAYLARFIAK